MNDHAHHGHHQPSPAVIPKDDHSDHGNSTSNSTAGATHNMMMEMFFHARLKETILFEFWETSEIGGLIGSMVFIFFLAFAYEALKFYREHLYRHSFRAVQYNTVTVPAENGGQVKETHKTVQVKMFSLVHSWQTVLHIVQTILSYFLMLIFMTYNVWLCLAVVLGAGFGYFFFGWKKSLVVDITEHCH